MSERMTPERWHVDERFPTSVVTGDPETGYTIAECCSDDREEDERNARRIAKLPELVEAAKAARDYFSTAGPRRRNGICGRLEKQLDEVLAEIREEGR